MRLSSSRSVQSRRSSSGLTTTTRASCRGYLSAITTPTLIIHALDDPFLFPASVPFEQEQGLGVTLELRAQGGHVGFVAGAWPWRPEYRLEMRILAFLQDPTNGGLRSRGGWPCFLAGWCTE